MRRALCWMLIALPLAGCATAGDITAKGGPQVYGGTRTDIALIKGDMGPDADPADVKKISRSVRAGAACCGLVDLPFSVIADTVMLPVTVPLSARRNRDDAEE